MSKTKLLVVGEQGIDTGFEKVVRGICTHLQSRGDYDVTVRGIGFDPRYPTRRYPYTVKDIGATDDDIFGIKNFEGWIEEDKPDALFIVHDIWQIGNMLPHKPFDLPTVAYFPVDAPCIKPSYAVALSAVSEAVVYTQFGAREAAVGTRSAIDEYWKSMRKTRSLDDKSTWLAMPKFDGELQGRWDRLLRYQNPQNFNVLPHGHEHGLFEPRDKARARSMFGIDEDAFVVLNVATNSPRKRLDLTIKAFAKFAKGHPNALLILHCGVGSPFRGWDLSAAAQYYGCADKILLSHVMYPRMSDDELCWLYNTADVQVNTSGGEGWGLTAFEGGACGVPQVVPDWSATRELWNGKAGLIPVKNTRMEPKFLNTVHCEIDTDWLAEELYVLSTDPKERTRLAETAFKNADGQHTWDDIGHAFHQVIQNAVAEPEPSPVSFGEMFAARAGELVSDGVDV